MTSYSGVLIEFIEPLLQGNETEEALLEKAKIGMMAWNYSITNANKLPFNAEMKQIMLDTTSKNPEAKEVLNQLTLRKEMLFSQFNQFFFHVEIKTKPDGSKTLYVESAPADKIGKK